MMRSSVDVGASAIHLGLCGGLVAVLAIVWSTNLFNFMDGIDGIAGVEATVVGTIAGTLLVRTAGGTGLGFVALAVAGAAAGFLCWNWQPARIFMGDVGSSFLGFVFATLALASERARVLPALVWVILSAAFIVDATVTLLRRIHRGYVSEAHRTHAYQRAVQSGWSHRNVASAVGVLGIVLGAVAVVATRQPRLLIAGVIVAVTLSAAAYMAVGMRVPFPILPPRRAR